MVVSNEKHNTTQKQSQAIKKKGPWGGDFSESCLCPPLSRALPDQIRIWSSEKVGNPIG